ncbi:hypothetical protein LWC33_15030 [Pseudonocardia sp. RS11V-5]|nr:hypothetical protein [Pseudonocardia terrae]MCE3552767.1 hypothetical protein [Pseudonocardia terrae]
MDSRPARPIGTSMLGEARTPRTQRLDTHLVVRGSTGPLTHPKTGVRS